MNVGLNGFAAREDSAIEAGDTAWWEVELPSGVIFFSDTKAKMLGYDPSKFVHYQDFAVHMHPDDREEAQRSVEDYLAGKTDVYRFIYRMRATDGSYRTYLDKGRIVAKEDNGTVRLAGVAIDITNDIEALRSLKPPQ